MPPPSPSGCSPDRREFPARFPPRRAVAHDGSRRDRQAEHGQHGHEPCHQAPEKSAGRSVPGRPQVYVRPSGPEECGGRPATSEDQGGRSVPDETASWKSSYRILHRPESPGRGSSAEYSARAPGNDRIPGKARSWRYPCGHHRGMVASAKPRGARIRHNTVERLAGRPRTPMKTKMSGIVPT